MNSYTVKAGTNNYDGWTLDMHTLT